MARGAASKTENLSLDVAVLSPDGTQRMWEKDSGSPEEAEAIGKRVAQEIARRRRRGFAGARKPRDTRMSAARPLEGKRVVVTRAVEQARDLMARLENMGATVLLFPAVSFSEPSDTAELDRAIRSLAEFDWILFTSANAVRFFAGRCRKLGVEPSQEGNYLCAAVGPATASAVAAEGFSVDHVAQEFLGAALARELSASLAARKFCCRAASAPGPICRMR